MLVQEVLECGRWPGRGYSVGRWRTAEALDVHGDVCGPMPKAGLRPSPAAAAAYAMSVIHIAMADLTPRHPTGENAVSWRDPV